MKDIAQTYEILKGYLDKLLASREPLKTICPSEVARALSREVLDAVGASSWRVLMPEARNMVAEMLGQDEVEMLQKGAVLIGELGEDWWKLRVQFM
jgi:hypothetical protein